MEKKFYRLFFRGFLPGGCLILALWGSGCAKPYNPHLPTDLVGYRYSMHRYMNRTFSQTSSSHRSGNYVVTVTTTTASRTLLGGQTLKYLDKTPHIATANNHIISRFPGLLKSPFRSVDGTGAVPQTPVKEPAIEKSVEDGHAETRDPMPDKRGAK